MIEKLFMKLIDLSNWQPLSFIGSAIVRYTEKNSTKEEKRGAMGFCSSLRKDEWVKNIFELRLLRKGEAKNEA
mgnify:CR=1 FL=1